MKSSDRWKKLMPWLVLVGAVGLMWLFLANTPGQPKTTNANLAPLCIEMSLSEQVATADVIMTGQVFLVVPNGHMANVIVTPDRIYKGHVTTPAVHIAALPSINRPTVGQNVSGLTPLHFSSDDLPYLFFLRQRTDGDFGTNECAGTRLLGSGLTAAESDVLGAGLTFTVDPAPLFSPDN